MNDEQLEQEQAAREARRRAWLENKLATIVFMYQNQEPCGNTEPAIEILREACEAWKSLD